MIESVSNTLPNPKISAMYKVSPEQLQSPGAYSRDYYPTPIFPEERRQNNGSFLGFLGKVLLGLIVTGGALIAARRYVPSINKVDLTKELAKDAKTMEKIKYDFAKAAGSQTESPVLVGRMLFRGRALLPGDDYQ